MISADASLMSHRWCSSITFSLSFHRMFTIGPIDPVLDSTEYLDYSLSSRVGLDKALLFAPGECSGKTGPDHLNRRFSNQFELGSFLKLIRVKIPCL